MTSAMSIEDILVKEIPDILYDAHDKKRYQKGRLLCEDEITKFYEITDLDTKEKFGAKIVPKVLYPKPHLQQRLESNLHRNISHQNVVGFHGSFEDEYFAYVILELCHHGSLKELLKRRKTLTEPETRYYMRQIIMGVQYLHENRVIHRDLKLGNLLLTKWMEIRIGGLGLAAKVRYVGERRKARCGTADYLAPEVLKGKGYSYEVDIWSLGCIMFALLIGETPFETTSLNETYARIEKNDYRIPSYVSAICANLMSKMLRRNPQSRPTVSKLLQDDFFTCGYLPPRLPTTCLTMAPSFPTELLQSAQPKPLHDINNGKRYEKGRLLGEGAYAECYEITDLDTKEMFAAKVFSKMHTRRVQAFSTPCHFKLQCSTASKALYADPHQKARMYREIHLHKSISHQNVVGFHGSFEDEAFVYVILELCHHRSLRELLKQRKTLTEPETRYYMKQIIMGVQYLHENKIIHRDLKLGNVFLTEDMEIRIGDLGLATKVDYDGQRKKTFCGTRAYIAPEVLGRKDYSYEVDIWSLGCIMYELLVGETPFKTASKKETYSRIKKNEYTIPSYVCGSSANLISMMLRSDPQSRPTASRLLQDDFFTCGYLPPRLPTTCLTMAPSFPTELLQSDQ